MISIGRSTSPAAVLSALCLAVLALAGAAAPAAQAAPRHVRASLLKDIWPGPKSSTPTRLVARGDRVFFAASSPNTGAELWSSDGTRAGTRLVADIVPGKTGSSPRGLTSNAERVYFTLLDRSTGDRRLWQSDGTAAEMKPVAGTEDLDVSNPVGVGDLVVFTVDSPQGGDTWASDGESPAVRLGIGKYAQPIAALGTTLLGLDGDGNGVEPWRTDGTLAGSAPLRDILPGSASSKPLGFTAFGDRVLFFATGEQGSELWSTDATAVGTMRITSLPAALPYYTDRTVVIGGRMLFPLANGELWTSDGTAAGTFSTGVHGMQADSLQILSRVGSTLYLEIDSRLWRTHGTLAGTKPLSSRRRVFVPSPPVRLGRLALFTAETGNLGRELLETDGTKHGTGLVREIHPGDHGSGWEALIPIGHRVVFAVPDGVHGAELWVATLER